MIRVGVQEEGQKRGRGRPRKYAPVYGPRREKRGVMPAVKPYVPKCGVNTHTPGPRMRFLDPMSKAEFMQVCVVELAWTRFFFVTGLTPAELACWRGPGIFFVTRLTPAEDAG